VDSARGILEEADADDALKAQIHWWASQLDIVPMRVQVNAFTSIVIT
jgi:hypothetical protein